MIAYSRNFGDYAALIYRLRIPIDHTKFLMPLFLTGGAKLKYGSLSDDDKADWKSMTAALAKKFKTQALLSKIRDELHNLRQGRESVGEFAKKSSPKLR